MPNTSQNTPPEERLAEIARALRDQSDVTPPLEPAPARMFGAAGLRINNKAFAVISSKDKFAVKLPRERVAELVASGIGEYFEPGPGRPWKDWLAVNAAFEDRWLSLAKEALEFVAVQH